MVSAIVRVGLVSVAVTVVIAGFIFLARMTGRQEGGVNHHPWFEHSAWRVSAPMNPCAPAGGAVANAIHLLRVRHLPDGWRTRCPGDLPLADFWSRTRHRDWLIEVEAGAGEDLDQLVEVLRGTPGRVIGIHAASQRAARALRKKAPEWAFAADDASLLRLHLFNSFYLETVVDFWPDFVISAARGPARLHAREWTELARRRKPVLWDDSATDDVPPGVVGRVERASARD